MEDILEYQGIGTSLDVLRANYLAIKNIDGDFSVKSITEALTPVFEKYGKSLTLNTCFRYPLSSKIKSANGLDIAYIIGKEETLKRLALAAKKLCDYGNWPEYYEDYWIKED